jgi:lysophospholipase L1-like esterase
MFYALCAVLIDAIFLLTLTVQALRIRRRMPRLPVPEGSPLGSAAGTQHGCTLLLIGESSAAGVGVRSHGDGLAAHIARNLRDTTGRTIHWQVRAKPGETILSTRATLLAAPATRAQVTVVALGVNDALQLRSPWRWYVELRSLLGLLRNTVGCELIVFAPVPPLWKFECLPLLLRGVIGAQALALDCVQRLITGREPDTLYVKVPFNDQQRLLCEDRFHPSAHGYSVWAAYMAAAIAPRLPVMPPQRQ